MKILFLSTIYPRSDAPTRGIFCLHTCRALAADHQVRVISPRSWVDAIRSRSAPTPPEGVGATEYPVYFHPPTLLRSRLTTFMWVSVRRSIDRVLRGFAPDCVLSYWAHPDGEVATRAARLAGVPVGVIVGGSDVLVLPKEPSRGRAVARALKAADVVFTVSQHLRDRTIQLGIDPARVEVVYQGVEPIFVPGDRQASRDRLGLTSAAGSAGGKILLWVGRMDPIKGLDVLVEACARLREECPKFRLLLVGDGPARPAVEAAVTRSGMRDHVHFVGPIPHDRLPDWYRAADLSVLSSHSEGIPNVLRESLACGTPYVATRVGGVAELSDDPAIQLVPPGDPQALADAIALAFTKRQELRASQLGTWREYARTILEQLMRRAPSAPGRS